ncbi:MAG: YebC/PmpR family DNA-binding transcriptional regulator [Clostridiales bacterium]|nr:YebC/PmpR family DNA-binding transcriptional regulator [Clostridiales bacterium]
MSGHSKWSNIKHKKEKTDAQRAAIFTKIGREIAMAVKAGGGDPNVNSKLRDVIAKAKANNMPNENIERSIKKALGGEGANYEAVTYEGYGPGGVAVIVETSTDNRNRTAGDIRHYFDKFGGNLGQSGCVGFLFSEKGVIVILRENAKDEEALMEAALEAGAADFAAEDEAYLIYTEPDDLYAVKSTLESAGYRIESAEKDKMPSTYVSLENDDDNRKMKLLLEHLEEHDDVVEVYHNWENEE